MHREKLSIVAAVNNRTILQNNLMQSPALAAQGDMRHQIILKENFPCAGAAYNSGLDEANHDLVAFVHQDVYLPVYWMDKVFESIRALDAAGVPWGVLGCFGVGEDETGVGQVYSTGWGLQGRATLQPVRVETLDEIVLIIRKSAGLRFDPDLPHFHMYGVDLCLEARQRGLGCYVLPAFCVHNTNQLVELPAEFKIGYRYVKRKWSRYLPIRTSCTVIDRFDRDLNRRTLEAFVNRALFRKKKAVRRVEDPRSMFQSLGSTNGVSG